MQIRAMIFVITVSILQTTSSFILSEKLEELSQMRNSIERGVFRSIIQPVLSFIFHDRIDQHEKMRNITVGGDTNKKESELTNVSNLERSEKGELKLSTRTELQFSNQIIDRSVQGALCDGGLGWCSHPMIQYPTMTISNSLGQQGGSLKNMFSSDLIPIARLRSGLDDDLLYDDNVCTSQSSQIRPRAAKNHRGKWMFLVNGLEDGDSGTEFLQLVTVNTCLGAGESCGAGRIFIGHSTECRQQYTDHKLVALDLEGSELVVDTFSFPSCCTCHLHNFLES